MCGALQRACGISSANRDSRGVFTPGAAIYAANLTDTLDSGIQKAQHIIDNGVAFEKLEQLCLISNRL